MSRVVSTAEKARQAPNSADHDGCQHRSPRPPRPQAPRLILRLDSQGSVDAGLDAGKPRGRSVMSHAVEADKLLIEPPATRRAGVPAHPPTIHSQGTHPRPEA